MAVRVSSPPCDRPNKPQLQGRRQCPFVIANWMLLVHPRFTSQPGVLDNHAVVLIEPEGNRRIDILYSIPYLFKAYYRQAPIPPNNSKATPSLLPKAKRGR